MMAALKGFKQFQMGKTALSLLSKQNASCTVSAKRMLNLQEYQSKSLMKNYDVNVQKFHIVDKSSDALDAANELMNTCAKELVIKAMILAGGRGKGHFDSGLKGGVHLTKDPTTVPDLCENMIGYKLTTKQTPPEGVKVSKVMIAEALDISRETYFAILMDREYNGPVMVGSPAGGMDIEEVAEKTPELIFKDAIDINTGMTDAQAMNMAKNLQFEGDKQRNAADQIKKLYELFLDVDATQVEINPLGETDDGDVVCFDAKMNFDDNAEFRQKKIFEMEDHSESDPREVEAAQSGLSYISMDGNIACLVNGAGLAMATMDMIQHCGGKPANFLDLGGGVQEEQVFKAFEIIKSIPQVDAILVNIFGGIVNCETIANGIVKAGQELDINVPLVVRLEGSNVTQAREILAKCGLPITTADGFGDAAQKVVKSISA